jgi:hypothetical protein
MASLAAAPAAAAAEPRTFETPDFFEGQVDGGGLVHFDGHGFRRLDLATGTDRYVHRRPRRTAFDVSSWNASAGRIAMELDGGGRNRRSGALIFDTNTGVRTRIPPGRVDDLSGCGRAVKLDDMSPSGDALITEAVVPCGRRRGHLTVTVYTTTGRRTLISRPTRHAFISSMVPPFRRLVGDHLMTQGERIVRVRDLSTGRTRVVRPLARRAALAGAALGPDGRVLIDEFRRVPGRARPRQIVRLVGPHQRGRQGTIVHDTRRAFAGTRFCGRRPVLFTTTLRARYQLILLEPRTVLASGVFPDADVDISCDAGAVAVTSGIGDERGRVEVFDLPQ